LTIRNPRPNPNPKLPLDKLGALSLSKRQGNPNQLIPKSRHPESPWILKFELSLGFGASQHG
jgi:hypothetical protein